MKCKCGSVNFRADVIQTVDITINENDVIEAGFDFSDSVVDRQSVYCDDCGANIAEFIK